MTAVAPLDSALGAGSLVVSGIEKRFGDSTVLASCSFSLAPGALTAVLGPSGCGKSTLASILAGYEAPTAGTVTLDGHDVRGPSHQRLLMFQESSLLPWLTVEQNVMFGPISRGERRPAARRRARAALDRVQIGEFARAYPVQLSGGMQRRAELARALVGEPALMILDEPFRGLDALTRAEMQAYYSELHAANATTTLFITTEIDEALLLADRLLLMTALPARVCEEIEVDLPRPRERESTLRQPRARELKRRALSVLHAEAAKAFAGGEFLIGGSPSELPASSANT